MDFRGHLRLPDDAGSGIPVVLRLDDIFVIFVSGDEELGAWRADDVVVERIFSNQFAIELAGEPMVFIAQDALGFAYEGVSAIEELQARLTKRRVFKRSRKRKEEHPIEQAAPTPTLAPAAAPTEPVADLEESVELQPTPIWTPPVSQPPPPPAQPATPPARQPAAIEPTATEPAELPVARIESERVSYPQPADAGRAESAVPSAAGSPPAPEQTVPAEPIEEVPDIPADHAEPVAVEPAPVEPVHVEPAEVVPGHRAAPQPEPEVQIEIEEVEAASGAGWFNDEPARAAAPVPPPQPAPQPQSQELEIEDVQVSSAGGADTYRPIDEIAEPAETAEPAATPEVADVEVGAEPEQPVSFGPAASAPPVEEVVAEAETVGPPVEEATPSAANGHGRTRHLAKPEKRSLRPSFLTRSKDKKIPEHDHEYGEPKTIGGLTRRVCEICGHVTFSGEDVYHGW